MRNLSRLRALTRSERWLLVQALVLMPPIASAVAVFGYGPVHRVLARWPRSRRHYGSDAAAARRRAESVARMVTIAATRGPVRAGCLRRSLLIWWLLQRDGIEAQLKVGVSRTGKGALDAHAWVTHSGRPLADAGDVEDRFPAFARDLGSAAERTP